MIHWVLEDHICRKCGGRMLRSVSGAGPTPGGDPIIRCANCGCRSCWCEFGHRGQPHKMTGAYQCVSFQLIERFPKLLRAFRSCGCDPEAGQEIGIVLATDYNEALKEPT